MLTASQFAAQAVNLPDYRPPTPKKGEQYGADADCYLCGGPTNGAGWPLKSAIKPTSIMFNMAAAPGSRTVCWQCVAMQAKSTYDAYSDAHPDMGLKQGKPMSWRCYSHAFTETGHECPDRPRWRELLLNPPGPPFLFIVSTTLQKHLIYLGRVSQDRDVYPLLLDDDLFYVDRAKLTELFIIFEQLYSLGFSKDSIVSGDYHHGQLLKVGIANWQPLEQRIKPYRQSHPNLMRLALYCGQKHEL